MKTMEMTDVVFETATDLQPPARTTCSRRHGAPLRYSLLAVITLLAAWIAFSVHRATDEIGTTMDRIDATLAQPALHRSR